MRISSLALCLLLAACAAAPAAPPESLWTARGTESYRLEAGESVQFRVVFDDLPVRAWILEVDGDYRNSDVNVLLMPAGELLYQKNDESRHRVRVPWGRGEEAAVTLTADTRQGGVYTVKFLAPPPDQSGRAFGRLVNRALEALDDGRGERAEALLGRSLRAGEDRGVAALLLAGLYRERGELERAAGMLDTALREDLPPELTDVRNQLAHQLHAVRHRLPADLAEIDRQLAAGEAREAVLACEAFLQHPDHGDWVRSEAQRRAGRAYHDLGELIRAQEHLDLALAAAVNAPQRALALYRSGLLQRDRGNADQARRALRTARELGLPPDLDALAAAQLTALGAEE